MPIQPELLKKMIHIEKPGRYLGGEYGTQDSGTDRDLTMCVSYPDLYEVGMSNQAVRILYNIGNTTPGIICDRVFSPAPDFEDILRQEDVPLFSLDSHTPIHEFDIFAVTMGYELLATNLLAILEAGKIPLYRTERTENDPIVIGGGPGITNPFPFSNIFDAVLIGEGEGELDLVLKELRVIKLQGGGRTAMLRFIQSRGHWWFPGKEKKTIAADYSEFGRDSRIMEYYPVSNLKTAQDHGVIEIMRGCINGCRFCHAGYLYRPCREKSISQILQEAEFLVKTCGYREISLSSLSSGDYSKIWDLLSIVNAEFSGLGVSFSLPSLRIDSFSIDNLEQLSMVRKSGLTFAVESPNDFVQKVINKKIDSDHIAAIMGKAKELGWDQAKFYFMIGLPGFEDIQEETEIIKFLRDISFQTRMKMNVNIGTFVPKPHTPFQWEKQLHHDSASHKIYKIRDAFKKTKIKVSYHSPYMSHIEGLIARGDSKTGDLIFRAYELGARFDSWEDFFKREIWEQAISEVYNPVEKSSDGIFHLPWENISLGVSGAFLRKELEKSKAGETTAACTEECGENCGKCNEKVSLSKTGSANVSKKGKKGDDSDDIYQVLFSFTKKQESVYLSHLNIMTIFERAFLRSGIDVGYTKGYNPKPKIEFAHPLMLGVLSEEEIGVVQVKGKGENFDAASLCKDMQGNLPRGISLLRAQRKESNASLMAMFAAGDYRIQSDEASIPSIYEDLQTYAELNSGILAKLQKVGPLELEARIVHQGKPGNLKNILKYLSGTDSPYIFLEKHSLSRIRLLKGEQENLIPFMDTVL